MAPFPENRLIFPTLKDMESMANLILLFFFRDFSALAGLDAEKENVAGSPPSAQSTPSMMKSRPAAPQASDKSEGAGGST